MLIFIKLNFKEPKISEKETIVQTVKVPLL